MLACAKSPLVSIVLVISFDVFGDSRVVGCSFSRKELLLRIRLVGILEKFIEEKKVGQLQQTYIDEYFAINLT